MGTSAPGLALQSGTAVQISRAEHFAPDVHSWSCSAVPVTHPLTGQVIGIIDVTGGDDAVSSIVLPLLSSTAKAAAARLSELYTPQQGRDTGTEAAGTELTVLGAGPALHSPGRAEVALTRRHAEILLLLHRFPDGISGSGLVERLWPVGGSEVTVRAEITRLRRAIDGVEHLSIEARPLPVARATGLRPRAHSPGAVPGRHRYSAGVLSGECAAGFGRSGRTRDRRGGRCAHARDPSSGRDLAAALALFRTSGLPRGQRDPHGCPEAGASGCCRAQLGRSAVGIPRALTSSGADFRESRGSMSFLPQGCGRGREPMTRPLTGCDATPMQRCLQ